MRTGIFAKWTAISVSLLFLLAACSPVSNSTAKEPQLTVFAAASLSEAFSEIGTAFEAEHPDTKVTFNFAGSQQLVQQIAQGAPADIFASANEAQMNKAVDSGLVNPSAVKIFAQNRLVIVTPQDNPAEIQSLEDFAKLGLKLVFAAKEVPAGAYALQVLQNAQSKTDYGSSFEADVLKNVVSYEENVRAVLAKVTLGEADAGIVYQSDVAAATASQVNVIDIPEAVNVTALYPAAVIQQSPNAELAQQFVDFLLTDKAQAILVRYGFTQVA